MISKADEISLRMHVCLKIVCIFVEGNLSNWPLKRVFFRIYFVNSYLKDLFFGVVDEWTDDLLKNNKRYIII